MDIQEKNAFEIAFDKKLGARGCQFDLDEDGNYEDRETLCGWHMWQAAKSQAVPEGFVVVPTLLSDEQYNQLEEVMQDNFGTTVSQSRDCITKIHNELVSIAQQPSSTSGCSDEP